MQLFSSDPLNEGGRPRADSLEIIANIKDFMLQLQLTTKQSPEQEKLIIFILSSNKGLQSVSLKFRQKQLVIIMPQLKSANQKIIAMHEIAAVINEHANSETICVVCTDLNEKNDTELSEDIKACLRFTKVNPNIFLILLTNTEDIVQKAQHEAAEITVRRDVAAPTEDHPAAPTEDHPAAAKQNQVCIAYETYFQSALNEIIRGSTATATKPAVGGGADKADAEEEAEAGAGVRTTAGVISAASGGAGKEEEEEEEKENKYPSVPSTPPQSPEDQKDGKKYFSPEMGGKPPTQNRSPGAR
jgi:hypothetical protein